MKKLMLAAFTVLTLFGLAACDVTPGGSCGQEGSQHTNEDGTVYTCKVNLQTGKNYWYH